MAVLDYYYHVTNNINWEDRVTLTPRVTSRCDRQEPSVPRICVCPTISGCFVAACPSEGYSRVYRTRKKVHAVDPYLVYDATVTGEKWILEPTEFVLVHEFDEQEILDFPQTFHSYDSYKKTLLSQRAALSRLKKHFVNIKKQLPREKWI